MKLPSASQIHKWDDYTIKNLPISSFDLMEKAAESFVSWFSDEVFDKNQKIICMCGPGNNGGDGLAIARMLSRKFLNVSVIHVFNKTLSTDNQKNLNILLNHSNIGYSEIKPDNYLKPSIRKDDIIIDALFGIGINRPLGGHYTRLIDDIYQSTAKVYSVDIPSGLMADVPSGGKSIIIASKTFTFQTPKISFMFPENSAFIGEWTIGNIGLIEEFLDHIIISDFYTTQIEIQSTVKRRNSFAHKGDFGHGLLICGSKGKIGAAILSAKAALKSGIGLITVRIPKPYSQTFSIAIPEAMIDIETDQTRTSGFDDLEKYQSIGIGCGIGQDEKTIHSFEKTLLNYKNPIVIDADGINILAGNKNLLAKIPASSILTPHLKEFERLCGFSNNHAERINKAKDLSSKYNLNIVLKGANTAVIGPDGSCYFNSTGNPGMATAGSGDVLTGIITSLLAQGYTPKCASILGVYVHGLSGDIGLKTESQESLIASDIISHLGAAFKSIYI